MKRKYGRILERDYEIEKIRKERNTMIMLFGIKYANEIKSLDLQEICKLANISENYATELRKAMKLSKYVIIK